MISTITLTHPEMKRAIDELTLAQNMFDNAIDKNRIDEAVYRIATAQAHIQVITNEMKRQGGTHDE